MLIWVPLLQRVTFIKSHKSNQKGPARGLALLRRVPSAPAMLRGSSGRDAARAPQGHGCPFGAGPRSVAGVREPRRRRGQTRSRTPWLLGGLFQVTRRRRNASAVRQNNRRHPNTGYTQKSQRRQNRYFSITSPRIGANLASNRFCVATGIFSSSIASIKSSTNALKSPRVRF